MNRALFCLAGLVTLLLAGNAWSEESVLVIYSEPKAEVFLQDGTSLGQSGKPLRLEFPSDAEQIVFVLKADGYQPLSVNLTLEEFRANKRIPEQGVLQLESEGSALPYALLVLLLGAGGTYGWIRSRRPPTRRTSSFEPEFVKGELLGKGATAEVFSATCTAFPEADLAVKILKRKSVEDETTRGRLLRSLESSQQLEHPNLVKLYSYGETEGVPYLLLERLDGCDLKQRLAREPRLSRDEILHIASNLCAVLYYLHQKTVVHRDVKPANIFLTRDNRVKLMDLEISRCEDSQDLTKTGVAIGTPVYMAPEQIRGQVHTQSDQYSLGIILFEMLTGQRPFRAETANGLVKQHINEPPPSMRALNPEITTLQEAVVNKMLAKQPQSRFPDLKAAREALEEALSDSDDQTATSI